MKLSRLKMIALLGATIAAPSFGQAGPGVGMGLGFNKGNTAGWVLMTPEERTAHRDKMLAAKTYDECKSIQEEQHKLMAVRAKEKGVALPSPRRNGCDMMKVRGLFK